ncbi:MAG: AAA family ATPase [Rhodospirillales bacterium]|nr:AAA family ATPase [Rhodospirillales bacterium]
MKIERLSLARYGHFTDQEIELNGDGGGTCLHVLLGANEAGKTTALSAITDLLFGIDGRTSYAFRHGYRDLRVGATLRANDGRRLVVRRRKGSKNTLLDEDDRPLDESVLAKLLGGADRALFTGLFGLTHASLRAGGEEMLEADGDLGRMLFEAGSSLAGAVRVLDEVEAEAAALFTPRRSAAKPFYVADDARIAAERKVSELTLRFDDWRQNERDLADTETALSDLCARHKRLEERRALLERIRRTRPRLGSLREVEAELLGLADAPVLPDDARERLEEARRVLDVARARLEREEIAAAAGRRELALLAIPEALLAEANEVQRLYDRRSTVLAGRDTLRELGFRREALRDELRRMYDGLGGAADTMTQAEPPPCEMALAELRRLIADDEDLCKRLSDIGERQAKAAAELASAEAELEAAAVPPDLARLELALAQAQCAGGLEAELAQAEQAAADAEARLGAALAGLRLWQGNADALAALPVPEHETVLRFDQEIRDAERLVVRKRDGLAAAREEEAKLKDELAAIEDGQALPTAAALGAARARRDQGWSLIRRVFVDGEPVGAHELEAFAPRPRLVEGFERAVHDADAIADHRQEHAERIARHDQLAAASTAAAAGRADHEVRVAHAERDLATLQRRWSALWLAIGIQAETPREMDRWLVRREDVLRTREASRGAARRALETRDRLLRERRELSAALAFAGAEPSATARFAALLEEARFRLGVGRKAEQARVELRQKCKSHAAGLQGELARRDALAEQRVAWSARWAAALERVRLPEGTSPAAAATALALWDDIRRTLADLVEVDGRICRIENEAATFAAEASQLLAQVCPDLAAAEPAAAIHAAFQRLQAARRDAQKRHDLQQRIEAALAASSTAAADAGEAQAAIDRLMASAGCCDEDQLTAAIDRSRRKAVLEARADALKREILADADGRSLGEAAAEAGGLDADRCQGELAALAPAMDELFTESQRLAARRQDLAQRRAQMAGAHGAAEAEQARRNALADLEDVSERWLVLKTAAFLLRRGVEQFRREQQGPLLARAEALFRALTLDSFVRFQIDYDEADKPCLLGVRADGSTCPTTGMSDGARDQLYLALRLAAIERYLADAEPLPFIADDLFVHFDDARASAGLESLVALGEKTQVLLFTHHRHLAELARRVGGGNRVRVQVLNGAL